MRCAWGKNTKAENRPMHKNEFVFSSQNAFSAQIMEGVKNVFCQFLSQEPGPSQPLQGPLIASSVLMLHLQDPPAGSGNGWAGRLLGRGVSWQSL